MRTRIKAKRNSFGIPQKVLASKAGISVNYLYKIENGKYKPPRETETKIWDILCSIVDEQTLEEAT